MDAEYPTRSRRRGAVLLSYSLNGFRQRLTRIKKKKKKNETKQATTGQPPPGHRPPRAHHRGKDEQKES